MRKVRITIDSFPGAAATAAARPACLLPEKWRPVMYLEIDALLRYPDGRLRAPIAADGARDFVIRALGAYEVRWLSRWCRTGMMRLGRLEALARILRVEAEVLRSVDGLDWSGADTKLDGIAWLEHLALHRPFVCVQDADAAGIVDERRLLATFGPGSRWHSCDPTERPGALRDLYDILFRERSPVPFRASG